MFIVKIQILFHRTKCIILFLIHQGNAGKLEGAVLVPIVLPFILPLIHRVGTVVNPIHIDIIHDGCIISSNTFSNNPLHIVDYWIGVRIWCNVHVVFILPYREKIFPYRSENGVPKEKRVPWTIKIIYLTCPCSLEGVQLPLL